MQELLGSRAMQPTAATADRACADRVVTVVGALGVQ
jgi:hypothetical protein